jgi:predicted transcriptional regulator
MKISNEKKEKISEQILSILYSNSPKPLFISKIAEELARDEEFIKKLLFSLKQKNMVVEIKMNMDGVPYTRRSRWKLSDKVYSVYSQHQT